MNSQYKKYNIKINDIDIQVIEYYGTLYRADMKKYTQNNNNTYPGADYKFFTLIKNNTTAYIKNKGYTYITQCTLISKDKPLILIDILDIKTRNNLSKLVNNTKNNTINNNKISKALDSAFPINNNRVIRLSNVNNITKYNPDYDVIEFICKLDGIDGYYMDPKGAFFHTEVALCRSGLNKIRCAQNNNIEVNNKILKTTIMPPKMSKKRKRNSNNDNTASNPITFMSWYNIGSPPPQKRARLNFTPNFVGKYKIYNKTRKARK